MRDPFAQRENERAYEDDAYFRQLQQERRDRVLEFAPVGPCSACGHFAAEVEPGQWLCACFGGYE